MKKRFQGTALPAILVITTSMLIVVYGILHVLTLKMQYASRQLALEQSLHIAEAGVNYYRWHLAHAPEDFQDDTESGGPYEHEFVDPQGQTIGKFSLEITPPIQGSSIVTIKSTGWMNEFPNIKRTVTVQYGKPSLARYSFLTNASSWYGDGITVNGRIHSNNGIRMDGTNLSLVTSAKEDYMCGSETGCEPPRSRPGIWGAGGDSGLWQFPVTTIDFDSISFDLNLMRDAAISEGLHLGPSGGSGYHIIFSENGVVEIKRVTGVDDVRGYSVPGQGIGAEGVGGCRRLYQIITSEQNIGVYNVEDLPIIFAEDNIWIEGDVKGRTTVVAATFPTQSSNVDIWINDNINYTNYDGSDVLGLISQNNIFFVRNLPEEFSIDAVLIAQKGKIIRHGYYSGCGYSSSHSVKDKLTINGALISYYKSYWNFGTQPESGFEERVINYDSNILYMPPPYFPTSGDFEFISWEEN